MVRKILVGGAGGSIGLIAAVICSWSGLQTQHFRLLATVTSGVGLTSALTGDALGQKFKRRNAKYLPLANFNAAIKNVSDRYAELPGGQDILVALNQVKDEIWNPPT